MELIVICMEECQLVHHKICADFRDDPLATRRTHSLKRIIRIKAFSTRIINKLVCKTLDFFSK